MTHYEIVLTAENANDDILLVPNDTLRATTDSIGAVRKTALKRIEEIKKCPEVDTARAYLYEVTERGDRVLLGEVVKNPHEAPED
jgi:hypothetical protein